jgi:hypothetical protein
MQEIKLTTYSDNKYEIVKPGISLNCARYLDP